MAASNGESRAHSRAPQHTHPYTVSREATRLPAVDYVADEFAFAIQVRLCPASCYFALVPNRLLYALIRTMRGLDTRSSRPADVARLLAQLRVPETRAMIIGEMEEGMA